MSVFNRLVPCFISYPKMGSDEHLIVRTKYGSIEGFKFESARGLEFDAFLGIPFAKPPVGDLRLEVRLFYSFRKSTTNSETTST